MKRFILPLLCIPMLLLSSCGEPPTVQSDFSASFTTHIDNTNYAGAVVKDHDSLTVTLSEPFTVSGMAFLWDGGSLSMRYAGHKTQANADYLPAESIPAALHNALAYLPQASYTETKNGEDYFTLPTPYGDAALTVRDGIPTSLTDPNCGIAFHFE